MIQRQSVLDANLFLKSSDTTGRIVTKISRINRPNAALHFPKSDFVFDVQLQIIPPVPACRGLPNSRGVILPDRNRSRIHV